MNPEFLRVQKLAEKYQVSRSFLYDLIYRGQLTAYYVGKAVFLQESDFVELIKSGKKNA